MESYNPFPSIVLKLWYFRHFLSYYFAVSYHAFYIFMCISYFSEPATIQFSYEVHWEVGDVYDKPVANTLNILIIELCTPWMKSIYCIYFKLLIPNFRAKILFLALIFVKMRATSLEDFEWFLHLQNCVCEVVLTLEKNSLKIAEIWNGTGKYK